MKKQKFDLIFSLGAGCPTSMLLRKLRLQSFSYPFDWIGGHFHIVERADILCHKFPDFLNPQDFQDTGNSFPDRGGVRRIVLNTKSGMAFHHDFLKDIPLEEDCPRIIDKYQRRITRLLNSIQKSQKILIVFQEYIVNPVHLDNNQQLIDVHQKLMQAFPDKQWFLLYFAYCPQMSPQDVKEEQLSPFITKVSANYKSLKSEDADWTVNEVLLNTFYKKLRLKKPFKVALKENLILGVAFLIPFRGIKRKFLGHFFKNYFEV